VFETSAEWPHMAAVERERRQRAAQAFEQSLRSSLNMRNARQGQGQGQGQRQGHMQVVRQSGATASDDTAVANVASTVEKGPDNERRRVRIKSDPSRRTVVSGLTDSKEDEGSLSIQIHIYIFMTLSLFTF